MLEEKDITLIRRMMETMVTLDKQIKRYEAALKERGIDIDVWGKEKV